jgi:8-oxo-dGTP pyrophosphatase MutT (NUDIX family)
MKKYLVVVECAIEVNGKFLLIKRPNGTHAEGLLSFPGGKVEEQDEKDNYNILKSAVKREVFEEVGLKLDDEIHYITSSYFADNTGTQVIDNIFYCNIGNKEPKVIPSAREVPEYYWMSRDDIMNAVNAPDWLKHYVELIRKYSTE